MLYDDMLSEIDEEDISDDTKAKRFQELHEFIKSQSHLHDEHQSAIIGSDDQNSKFQE